MYAYQISALIEEEGRHPKGRTGRNLPDAAGGKVVDLEPDRRAAVGAPLPLARFDVWRCDQGSTNGVLWRDRTHGWPSNAWRAGRSIGSGRSVGPARSESHYGLSVTDPGLFGIRKIADTRRGRGFFYNRHGGGALRYARDVKYSAPRPISRLGWAISTIALRRKFRPLPRLRRKVGRSTGSAQRMMARIYGILSHPQVPFGRL